MRRSLLVALLLVTACGCGRARNPAPPPEPYDFSTGLLDDGMPCLNNGQCAGGVCAGRGCTDDEPGKCMSFATLTCDEKARAFCTCDGNLGGVLGKAACWAGRYRYIGACRPGDRGMGRPWTEEEDGSGGEGEIEFY